MLGLTRLGFEIDFLIKLDELEWESSLSRRVQHFGFTFDYETRRVNTLKTRAFPPFLLRIAQRALREKLLLFEPDQCTVNEYQPGQGIRSHVDTHSAFEVRPPVCGDVKDFLLIPSELFHSPCFMFGSF